MTQPLPTALDQQLLKLIAVNGAPFPSRQYLNIIGASAVDDPTFTVDGQQVGSTDVTISGGSSGALVLVNVDATDSPYAAEAFQSIVVDTSLGNVVIDLPSLPAGKWVEVIQDATTSFSTYSITVNAPPGIIKIAELPPNNGSFAFSVVISGSESLGAAVTWFNGGSSNGYYLAK